jgi:hypothetical protein
MYRRSPIGRGGGVGGGQGGDSTPTPNPIYDPDIESIKWNLSSLGTTLLQFIVSSIIFMFVILLIILVVYILLFVFVWPVINTSSDNEDDINSLKSALNSLTAIVSSHTTSIAEIILDLIFINDTVIDIINNPPAEFAFIASDHGLIIEANETLQKLIITVNDGVSASVYESFYNDSSNCFNGSVYDVNDTVIIKSEVTGTPLDTISSLVMQITTCNGSLIDGQHLQASIALATGTNQTWATDFFYKYTQEIADAGGTALWFGTTGGFSFDVYDVHYLAFRYRRITL